MSSEQSGGRFKERRANDRDETQNEKAGDGKTRQVRPVAKERNRDSEHNARSHKCIGSPKRTDSRFQIYYALGALAGQSHE